MLILFAHHSHTVYKLKPSELKPFQNYFRGKLSNQVEWLQCVSSNIQASAKAVNSSELPTAAASWELY